MASIDREEVSTRTRKSSSRRSSILKLPKSPAKNVLTDLDQNTGSEHEDTEATRTLGKKRKNSRRVSFAETFQVKEFVKDNGTHAVQWPNTDSLECKGDASLRNSNNQPISNAGLESLLTGAIENEVPLSVVQKEKAGIRCTEDQVHDVTQTSQGGSISTNQNMMDMTVASAGGDVKLANKSWDVQNKSDKIDSKSFLQGLCTTNTNARSGCRSLILPEKQPSPTKHNLYDEERKTDLETMIHTSVNKYLGSTTVMTYATANNTRGGSMSNMDCTRLVNDPMEMTGVITENMQHVGQNSLYNRKEICNATWANESTKVFGKSYFGSVADDDKTMQMDFTECVGGVLPANKSSKTLNALSSTKIYDVKGDEDFVFSPNLTNISTIPKNVTLFDSDEEDMEMTQVNENVSMLLHGNMSLIAGSNDITHSPLKPKIDTKSFLKGIMSNENVATKSDDTAKQNKTIVMTENMDMTTCLVDNQSFSDRQINNCNKTVIQQEDMDFTTCIPGSPLVTYNCKVGKPSVSGSIAEKNVDSRSFLSKILTKGESTSKEQLDASQDLSNKTRLLSENMDLTTCVVESPVKKVDSKKFLSMFSSSKSNNISQVVNVVLSDNLHKTLDNASGKLPETSINCSSNRRSSRQNSDATSDDMEFTEVVIAEADSSNVAVPFVSGNISTVEKQRILSEKGQVQQQQQQQQQQLRKGLSDITHVFNADDTVADMEPTMCGFGEIVCDNNVINNGTSTSVTMHFNMENETTTRLVGHMDETTCIGGIVSSTKSANKSVCFNLDDNTVHKFDIIESQLSLDTIEDMLVKEVEKEENISKGTSVVSNSLVVNNAKEVLSGQTVIPKEQNKTVYFGINDSGMMDETACNTNGLLKTKALVDTEELLFSGKEKPAVSKQPEDGTNRTVIFSTLNKTASGGMEETLCVEGEIIVEENVEEREINKTKFVDDNLGKTTDPKVEGHVSQGGVNRNKTLMVGDAKNLECGQMNETACIEGLKTVEGYDLQNVATNKNDRTVVFSCLSKSIAGMEETACVGGLFESSPDKEDSKKDANVASSVNNHTNHDIFKETELMEDESILDFDSENNVIPSCSEGITDSNGEKSTENVNKTHYYHNENTAVMDFTSVVTQSPLQSLKAKLTKMKSHNDISISYNNYNKSNSGLNVNNQEEKNNEKTRLFTGVEQTACMDMTSCTFGNIEFGPDDNENVNLTAAGKSDNTLPMLSTNLDQKLKRKLQSDDGDKDSGTPITGVKATKFSSTDECVNEANTYNKEINLIAEKEVLNSGNERDALNSVKDDIPISSVEELDHLSSTKQENVQVQSFDRLRHSSTASQSHSEAYLRDTTLDLVDFSVISCKANESCAHNETKVDINATSCMLERRKASEDLDTDQSFKKSRLLSKDEMTVDITLIDKPGNECKNNQRTRQSSSSTSSSNSSNCSLNKSAFNLTSSNSSCNKSIFSSQPTRPSLGHSISHMSLIEDYNLSVHNAKSFEDYLRLFSVQFNERKIRHSTMAPVSVRPPENVSEALQQVIYEPQIETYEWACEQLNILSDKCKEITTDIEGRLLKKLPDILLNEPGDPETSQKLSDMKSLSRKKARTKFKNWKCKMFKKIGESLKQEVQGLKTGVQDVTQATQDVECTLENLYQVKKQLEDEERKNRQNEEERLTNVALIKEKQQKKEDLETECHVLENERTHLSVNNTKLKEQLDKLEKDNEKLNGKLKVANHMDLKQMRSFLSHLRCVLFYDIIKWEDNAVELGLLPEIMTLKIEFGECLESVWYKDLHHRRIRSIKLVAKNLIDEDDDESLGIQMGVNFLLQRFSAEKLLKECPDTTLLAMLMHRLSLSVYEATRLIEDINNNSMSRQHDITFDLPNNRIVLVISSLKAHVKFDLSVTISEEKYPNQLIPWQFKNYIGDVRLEDLQSIMDNLKPGFAYFKRIVNAVVKYVQEKERQLIFSK